MEDDLQSRGVVGSTTLPLGARDETWDAAAARKSMNGAADYKKYHFWQDPDGDPDDVASYKLPFGHSGHAVWSGVTHAAGRLDQTNGPTADDKKRIRSKIDSYRRKAAEKYDDPSLAPQAASSGDATVEVRYIAAPLTHIDVRDPTGNDDNTWTMSGYAAVFNQKTVLMDGKFRKITESLAPTAFDRVLRDQPLGQPDGVVHFNHGHEMTKAVAATNVTNGQPGSLQLCSDDHGLYFFAKVARDDPDAVALASKMRTGVVRQASFAFTIARESLTETTNDDEPDEAYFEIQEVKHLYDVCACAQGAYATTVSQIRSYAAAIGQPTEGWEAGRVSPARGGASLVNPTLDGVVAVGGARGDQRSIALRKRQAAARMRRAS